MNKMEQLEKWNKPLPFAADGKLQLTLKDDNGRAFKIMLNAQKSGHYALKGTLQMVDPVSHAVLTNEKGRASRALHVLPTNKGENQNVAIGKAVKTAAFELVKDFDENYKASLKTSRILGEMTLGEAVMAFGQDAAFAHSDKPSLRAAFQGNIDRLSKKLAKPFAKMQKKDILAALPENCTKATQLKYIKDFLAFVEYLEKVRGDACGIRNLLNTILNELGKVKKRGRTAKDAANSDVLSNEAEGAVNEIVWGNRDNPHYIALALAKGTGLSVSKILNLKVSDMERMGVDSIFVRLHLQFVSATQNYTFPIFPKDALAVSAYLDSLAGANPEDYLLSTDGGTSPLDGDEVNGICRKVLTQVAFSYAIAIGRSDLKKVPGIKLLQDTYRYRQETYCGITEQSDKGSLQFMLHRTLGNNVQADYYRSFTQESGRQFLLDAVQLDRRFMEGNRRKRRVTTKVVGEKTVYTFPAPPDGELGAIHTFTLDLLPDQLAQFQVPQGCYISFCELD